MPKIIGFIRRRPDLGFAAFSEHWRTVHRAHAERLRPWLSGYVQAHYRPGPLADVQRPADGSPLLWVAALGDMAALAASRACREGATLDEPNFMEGRSAGLAVDEVVVLPPPPLLTGAVKLMLFARLAGTPPRALLDDSGWLCPVAHAVGRVVNHALPGQTPDPAVAFDAVEEIWWPDEASFARDWQHARPVGAVPWLSPGIKAAFVDEVEVFAPPR